MTENEIAKIIVDIAYKIHVNTGPGIFESVYESILVYELNKRKIKFERQKAIPVIWDNINMDVAFRADLIIENKVIIEIKSVEKILQVHRKQLLTYLKLTNIKLGLLINFNEKLIKD